MESQYHPIGLFSVSKSNTVLGVEDEAIPETTKSILWRIRRIDRISTEKYSNTILMYYYFQIIATSVD